MSSKSRFLLSAYSLLRNNNTKLRPLHIEDEVSLEGFPRYEESIIVKLAKLPKVKAQPGFDQRMAAAFAMELQKETLQRNRSWLEKHPKIKLPGIITDLKKNIM